ncbi:hypothetical protein V6Z11_A08G140600 [Gossypium hirsutum]
MEEYGKTILYINLKSRSFYKPDMQAAEATNVHKPNSNNIKQFMIICTITRNLAHFRKDVLQMHNRSQILPPFTQKGYIIYTAYISFCSGHNKVAFASYVC